MTDVAVNTLEEHRLSGLDFNLRARRKLPVFGAAWARQYVEHADWLVIGGGSVLCLIAGMACGVWLQF